jgi:hypothetical protein
MIGIIIGTFVVGVLSGLWLNITMYRSAMRHAPDALIDGIRQFHASYQDDLDNDDEDIDGKDTIVVSFEKVNTHWYLYDVSTNIFAGQGRSLDEAVAAVEARFPSKEVIVQQVEAS